MTTQPSKEPGIISYYVAISLDGYLARKNGSVDWLSVIDQDFHTPFEYKTYYPTVDAVLLGRKTYEIARLFEENPYSDKPLFIFTHNSDFSCSHPNYKIINKNITETLQNLKKKYANRIWLVGGGEIASQFFAMDLIDEIIVAIAPISLGEGISWMPPHALETIWHLKGMWSTSAGAVQIQYIKIKS